MRLDYREQKDAKCKRINSFETQLKGLIKKFRFFSVTFPTSILLNSGFGQM